MRKIAVILFFVILFASCDAMEAKSDAQNISQMPTESATAPQEKIMYELSENIAVNQVGYSIAGKKIFWVTKKADTFDIVRVDSGEVVFSGNITMLGLDEAIGKVSGYGDFSAFMDSGKYFVAVDQKIKSFSFEISIDAYNDLSSGLLKMLYFQRCGEELAEGFAGEYAHDACHLEMGEIWNDDGKWDGTGGWHDAGDYGKYTVPCARTVADLLFAYQLYPETFSDNTNIPESGNGIPDILDEAKVGLDWLLKMQKEDGSVYHKFTSAGFCGMVMPENDYLTQYAISVSPTATAAFSAVMAKAAMVYRQIDEDFYQKCRAAAIAAWDFLRANPNLKQFENPDGVTTGDYKDTSDEDERYWAAIELYLLTDEKIYLDEAKSLYSKHTALFWSDTLEWYDVGFLGTFSYLLSEKEQVESEFYKTIKADTMDMAGKLVNLANKKAFGVAMSKDDYIWGSNMVLTNRANVLLMAYEINPDPKYIDIAQAHLDYLLGTNGLSQCYVTGFGQKAIMYPHHRPSVADRIKTPIPAMVSGGPNSHMQDSVAQSTFNENTSPALCFSDETAAYSLNEVTTYWNSSALFCVAGLIHNK